MKDFVNVDGFFFPPVQSVRFTTVSEHNQLRISCFKSISNITVTRNARNPIPTSLRYVYCTPSNYHYALSYAHIDQRDGNTYTLQAHRGLPRSENETTATTGHHVIGECNDRRRWSCGARGKWIFDWARDNATTS